MGAKWRTAKKYGDPQHETVIEPFAGSAAYSVYHEARNVLLYDTNFVICGIWHYLIHVAESEILSLPVDFDSVEDLQIPEEAKWLIGFWITKGNVHPNKTRSAWARQYRHSGDCKVWSEAVRVRIASQVSKIRDWRIFCQDYRECPDIEATWFIDPPYQISGRHYPKSEVNYEDLAQFCLNRKGQTIVCEMEGANWLPFQPFATARAMIGKGRAGFSKELVYTA